MATKKKARRTPDELRVAAVQIALKMLQSDTVKDQMKRAPAAVAQWATERRAQHHGGRLRATASSLNPFDRFGQRGLERRIEHLSRGTALAFGERTNTGRSELWDAVDELKKASVVASGLPALKRKRMHRRIDNELDKLEIGLIDALLPKSSG